MDRSTEINELAAAFAAAQGEIENVERTHTAKIQMKAGGSYSYSYSDLSDILGLARPILSRHGLCITGQPTRNGKEVSFAPLLLHSSGQYIQYDALVLEAAATDPQSIGSTITYNRRYSIGSILNIASEADDDGNAGSGHDAETGLKPTLPPCPKCGKTTSTIKGKPEYGGGLVCFKDGCKHKWSTPEFPACDKQGNPIVEPEHAGTVQKTLPTADVTKPASKPPEKAQPGTPEYESLAATLRTLGITKPDDATAVVNYAVAGVGPILGLKTMKHECKQIEDAVKSIGLSGDELLKKVKSNG